MELLNYQNGIIYCNYYSPLVNGNNRERFSKLEQERLQLTGY